MIRGTHWAIALAFLTASVASHAQQWEPTKVELTPFVGYQSEIEFTDQNTGSGLDLDNTDTAGLIVDVALAPDMQLEFLYSRADSGLTPDRGGPALTDIKVEYLHVGAFYIYQGGRVRPFFGATGGATRFSPDAPGLDSDTRFSLGLAGGVKLFLARNIGVRLEARAFATQVDSDSAAFCNNGTCRIFYDGDFIWQYMFNAGVIVAF
jgi:hypothetical protein